MEARRLPSRACRGFVLKRFWTIAAALAPAIVAAAVFLLVLQVVLADVAAPFDHAATAWIRRADSTVVDAVMRTLTIVGKMIVLVPAACAIAAWAWREGARQLAVVLVTLTATAIATMSLLKVLFARERPDLFFEITAPTSYSFPSGHALLAVAVYGFAAVVVARLRPRLRGALSLAAPLAIAGIGVSRVYLGVHWPTDVLAGFAVGFLFLLAARHAAGPPGAPRLPPA